MTSIRRWLLGWLIFGVFVMCLAAAAGIFHTARSEAGELFDYELRTVAMAMPANIATAQSAAQPTRDYSGISDDLIAIDIWDRNGKQVYPMERAPALPQYAEGFHSVEFRGHDWRVFGHQQDDRFVQVAQPFSVRDDLALSLAWRTLWPLALLFPITIALVSLVVAKGMAPIAGLSRALSTRSLESLEPLRPEGRVPVEIGPLVDALNDLLQRLNAATKTQRTFIADAAHELRTPLAALKLQIQAAIRGDSVGDEPRMLLGLETRLNRIIHLAQQLLTMAREDAQQGIQRVPVSLRRLAEQSVADFSLLAEAKDVDLGLEWERAGGEVVERDEDSGSDNFMIRGEEHGLGVLLNNLIDNAIRHTPAGGRVDVRLLRSERQINFMVRDTGSGVDESELERLFDRFYRGGQAQGQGSGLGLAIAQHIAQRHHATLTLRNRTDCQGVEVLVDGLETAPDSEPRAASAA